MNEDSDRLSPRLELTRWSLIRRAGVSDEQTRRDALDELLRQYLAPLKAHLVIRRGVDRHLADDLIQEFIAQKILHRDLLSTASPVKGRFRSLLLSALDRFTIDHFRSAEARHQRQVQSLDDSAVSPEILNVTGRGHADAFDLAWATTVLAESIRRMQSCCESSNRADLWGVFYHRVLAPMLADRDALEYDQLVKQFALLSPEQASNRLITAKRLFHRELLAVVREYLDEEDEVESELVCLRTALASHEALHDALASVFTQADVSSSLPPIESRRAHRLAALLSKPDGSGDWQPSDLQSMFAHQLSMALTTMLSRSEIAQMSKLAMELMHSRPPIRTLSDLLHHPRPPRDLLVMAHRWTLESSKSQLTLRPIADAVGLCVQATAIAMFGEPVERKPDTQFHAAWSKLLSEGWLPNREVELLHRALAIAPVNPRR